MKIRDLTLEIERITIRGKTLEIARPKSLEEIFQGDPFFESEKFPLWFKIWEASIVLADYIATLKPSLKILEIGSGLGVVSLFASAFGHEVMATDKEELPLLFIEESARLNELSLKVQKLDIYNPEIEQKFDLILGAEIITNKRQFEPLLNLFKNFLSPKGEVVIAHSSERKGTIIAFLSKAQDSFEILSSIRKLRSQDESIEIILNRLVPKIES